jgi:hypothetical protein
MLKSLQQNYSKKISNKANNAGGREMKKTELIGKLQGMMRRTSWDDGMGQCCIEDFVNVPESIKNDKDIMDALWYAIENRNGYELEMAGNNVDADSLGEDETWQNRVWEMWTNGNIKFDYNDIQELINHYDPDNDEATPCKK